MKLHNKTNVIDHAYQLGRGNLVLKTLRSPLSAECFEASRVEWRNLTPGFFALVPEQRNNILGSKFISSSGNQNHYCRLTYNHRLLRIDFV